MNERDIFIEALQHPAPADRRGYLEQACREDDHLRQRVEALIAAHEQAGSFLREPTEVPVTTAMVLNGSGPNPAEQERPGSQIGPYTLRESIGEGGMGTVFLAEQSQPLRRTVALKVIKPGMDTKQVIARFEAERQALALMDHPNIARVLDGGTTESGRPYFVMELVRGIPITDYCDRERLSIPERLELFVLVCRAVQHAHQKGVIHRDLKPSNVLVAVIDGVAVPKVIDFGVAKATGQSLTERTLLTGFHHFVGTPLYMSPEQAELSGVDVDTRSDIYSLGVLLYQLLTGTTPFDTEALGRAAFDEVRRIIREEEPPTPSSRLRELSTTLSTTSSGRPVEPRKWILMVRGELDWIVMKALEKDRTRRYETANDFAADVLRHLADQPVEACPPSRWYHARKFVRRNRSRIAATGLIGVLGLGLAIAVGWQAMERAARRAETAGAATRLLDAADQAMAERKWPEALAAANQAQARLDQGGGDALRSRSARLKQDLAMVSRLDEIRQVMTAVKDDHFDIGLADRLYGEAFRGYGIDVDALSPDAVASTLPAGPVREELIAALDDWMRIRRGMSGRDDADWQRLLAAARAADPDPWRNRVREAWVKRDGKALGELAASAPFDRLHPCDVLLLEANLDNDRAVAVLREAQRRRPGDFWLNHALGMRLHGMRPSHFDEAIGYLRTASALRPESPGAILNLGHVLQLAEKTEEAIAAYEQAIRLKPDYPMAYSNLGAALIDAERFDEAIRACREAIRLDPGSAAGHGSLGRALLETGDLDGAIAALREALRLEPDSHLAGMLLAEVCLHKVTAGLQVIRRWIDRHLVRLPIPRPFLQTLLDPRSPPMLRRHFVLKMLAAGVLASQAYARPPRYRFTSFDVPGATFSRGLDTNHAGTIVGIFRDAAGASHGYYWNGGVFTPVDVPGSTYTGFWAINDAGVGVGRTDDSQGTQHGFVYDGSGFSTVEVPGATLTVTRGINLAGDMVGVFTDAAGTNHGFLLSGGQLTTIDYPNANSTLCSGINNNGQIVGHYVVAGKEYGFLMSGGQFTSINFPKAVSTMPRKVNTLGQVVGEYKLSDGKTHGFVLIGGTYTAINFPNATTTTAMGINDAGTIVGSWNDAAGRTHGFYAVKR